MVSIKRLLKSVLKNHGFRCLGTVVFLFFLVWITPLGAVVDVSKEDLLCKGKRTICLCTQYLKTIKKAKSLDLVWRASKPITQKTSTSYPSSPDYLGEAKYIWRSAHLVNHFSFQFFIKSFNPIRLIEHVPRS